MKIDNTDSRSATAGRHRPADVVYEEVVEGNITRLLAIFNSTLPDQVGPIRSVRPTDPTSCGRSAACSPTRVARRERRPHQRRRRSHAIDENDAGNADVPRIAVAARAAQPLRPSADLFGTGGEPVPPEGRCSSTSGQTERVDR